MKTLIATLLIALFAQGAVAQIERGTIRLGPTFEFSTESEDDLDIKSSKTVFGINASYFVIQNLGVGVDIHSSFINSDFGTENTTETAFGVGPHIMYMIPLSEQFYLPIYARYLFLSENIDRSLTGELKGTGTILGLGTGIEYVVANKLGLRLNVGYEFKSVEFEDMPITIKSESSGIRSSLGVGIYF
jgi:hypothetical protein